MRVKDYTPLSQKSVRDVLTDDRRERGNGGRLAAGHQLTREEEQQREGAPTVRPPRENCFKQESPAGDRTISLKSSKGHTASNISL